MRFNRRWFTRVNYTGRVTIKTPEGMVINALVKNLSIRGMYVITDEILPAGRSIEIFFESDSNSNNSLIINGIVARTDSHGFAVEFEKMDLLTFCRMKSIMYNFLSKTVVVKEVARYFKTSRK